MFFGCFNEYDVVAGAFGIFGIVSVTLGKSGEIVETYVYWESRGCCYCSTKLCPVDVSTAEEEDSCFDRCGVV